MAPYGFACYQNVSMPLDAQEASGEKSGKKFSYVNPWNRVGTKCHKIT